MKLHLAGRNKLAVNNMTGTNLGCMWEVIGVFDDYDKALESCIEEYDFVATIELNKFDNEDVKNFETIIYPHFTH